VPSSVYSMSTTSFQSAFVLPDHLLSKVLITAPYRCLPGTCSSSCHVHCIRRPRFPILSASLSHPQSTPWHRHLFKVFSYSRTIYLVNSQSRFRLNHFPDTSTSRLLVHCLPHPLGRQKHQPQQQYLHFPCHCAYFLFRPWKVTFASQVPRGPL
jgi:hypothetical protein